MNKVLFPLDTRSASTFNGEPISVAGFVGGRVYVTVTSGNGTATVQLQVRDPISTVWINIPGAVTIAASTTTAATMAVHPALTGATNTAISQLLGDTVRGVLTVASATAVCDVTMDLIR